MLSKPRGWRSLPAFDRSILAVIGLVLMVGLGSPSWANDVQGSGELGPSNAE